MNYKKTVLTSLIILSVVAFAAVPAQAKIIMTLGHAVSEDHSYHAGALKFAELVDKYTNGAVEVKAYCCFKMGGEQQMFKKLQMGTLDATIIAQNNIAPFFPLMNLFVLPYTFESFEHAEKVIDGKVGKTIAEKLLQETGVELLAWYELQFRNMYNTKRGIQSIADLKGLRMRVPKNKMMLMAYEAYGASPTPLAWADTVTSTQTGTVDGGCMITNLLIKTKMAEIAKHVAIVEHFIACSPLLASEKFMNKLTPKQKEALRKAAYESSLHNRKIANKLLRETMVELETKYGAVITRPDKAPFIAAVKKMKEDFVEENGPEYGKLLEMFEEEARKLK